MCLSLLLHGNYCSMMYYILVCLFIAVYPNDNNSMMTGLLLKGSSSPFIFIPNTLNIRYVECVQSSIYWMNKWMNEALGWPWETRMLVIPSTSVAQMYHYGLKLLFMLHFMSLEYIAVSLTVLLRTIFSFLSQSFSLEYQKLRM